MVDMINSIVRLLTDGGVQNVYSVFDGEPLRSKGEYAVLVGMKSFEAMTPVYSEFTVYLPFKAEVEITVAAPADCSVVGLCSYFEEKIRPVIDKIPELCSRPASVVCRMDRNIGRLVLSATVRTEGVRRLEREAEA